MVSELGDLLELLHDAPHGVRTLQAVITTESDAALTMRAWQRGFEESGATMYAAVEVHGDDTAGNGDRAEESTSIWIDLGREHAREERAGVRESLAVSRDGRWWRWDPDNGPITDRYEDVGTDVAQDRRWIMGGLKLLAPLRLTVQGHDTVASRRTIRCRAERRPSRAGEHNRDEWDLHTLPAFGAERYEIDVDQETGLLLRVAGYFEDRLFSETTVMEIALNGELADELFEFASPDGTPARSSSELHGRHYHDLRVAQLLELAPFRIFVPQRVPRGWEINMGFYEGSMQPPVPQSAHLHLGSQDGTRSVTITQCAASDAAGIDEWDHADPAPWQNADRNGLTIEFREANADWQPTRVRLEREGTRLLLDSTSLDAEALLDLAVSLHEPDEAAPRFD